MCKMLISYKKKMAGIFIYLVGGILFYSIPPLNAIVLHTHFQSEIIVCCVDKNKERLH